MLSLQKHGVVFSQQPSPCLLGKAGKNKLHLLHPIQYLQASTSQLCLLVSEEAVSPWAVLLF